MKQDLREALPKVRNPPSFTLRKEKTKEVSRSLLKIKVTLILGFS